MRCLASAGLTALARRLRVKRPMVAAEDLVVVRLLSRPRNLRRALRLAAFRHRGTEGLFRLVLSDGLLNGLLRLAALRTRRPGP